MGARERLPVGHGVSCAFAAGGGHLEVLQWARENGCPWDEAVTELGARESVCPWNERPCTVGGRSKPEVARERACPWNEDTCAWAAEGGHLEMLVLGAREQVDAVLVGRFSVRGRARGHLEALRGRARTNAHGTRADVRVRGGGVGHLEVLKWARARELRVEREDVRDRGEGRPPRDVERGRARRPTSRGTRRRARTRRRVATSRC